MKTVVAVLAIAALCICAWAAGSAAVGVGPTANLKSPDAITIPQMLSYQGKLTDTSGVPVPNNNYNVTFKLYTVPTGGSAFWNETQTVTTKSGLFSVLLGSVSPIGSVPEAGVLYLGMTVASGTELSPRLRLVGSAYSYLAGKSANSDQLQGKDTSGFVRTGQANSVTSAMIVNGAIAAADLGQMGADAGQVMKWTGSVWAPANDSTGGLQRPITPPITGVEIAKPCSLVASGSGQILYLRSDNSDWAIYIDSAWGGLHIKKSYYPGVQIDTVVNGQNAIRISYASSYAVSADSTGGGGFRVMRTGGKGLNVGGCTYGVQVTAATQYGVYAEADAGKGGYFRNNNNSNYALTAYNASGASSEGIYVNGQGVATGGWTSYFAGGSAAHSLVGPDLELVTSGSGVLSRGQAAIVVEPTVQRAISTDVPLKVIVTPTSECNGLLVVSKSADGFTVRELLNGQSDATFDWLVIGRIKGGEKRPDAPKRAEDEANQRGPEEGK